MGRTAPFVVLAAMGAAGCFDGTPPGDVGVRIENRSQAAYGLHVAFLDDANASAYEVDVQIRHGEVGTHAAPLPDGVYTVALQITRGPGTNREADERALPPSDDGARLEVPVDGTRCEGLALVGIVILDGGALGATGQRCEP
ncbi:MAG: hypothetical protein ACRDH5_07765 [bacterium]